MISAVFWLVILVVVVGFLVWLIDQINMDPNFKAIAKGILIFAVVLAVIFFVAGLLGIGPGISYWGEVRPLR